jgi:hypothetical protein
VVVVTRYFVVLGEYSTRWAHSGAAISGAARRSATGRMAVRAVIGINSRKAEGGASESTHTLDYTPRDGKGYSSPRVWKRPGSDAGEGRHPL